MDATNWVTTSTILLRLLDFDDGETWSTFLYNRAQALSDLERHAEAAEDLRANIDVLYRIHGDDHVEIADQMGELAECCYFAGELDEYRTVAEAALEMLARLGAGEDRAALRSVQLLDKLAERARELETARDRYRQAIEMAERATSPRPSALWPKRKALAKVLLALGDRPAARLELERALAELRAAPGREAEVRAIEATLAGIGAVR